MTEKKTKKMTTIISTIATIIAVSIGSHFGRYLISPRVTFDKQLMKFAEEMNKNCPMMVDSETRLDNAIGLPEKILNYNYTLVNYTVDQLDAEALTSQLSPGLINNVKTHPDMENFRKNKVTLKYTYKDKDGKFITSIEIKPSDYN